MKSIKYYRSLKAIGISILAACFGAQMLWGGPAKASPRPAGDMYAIGSSVTDTAITADGYEIQTIINAINFG